MRAARKFLFDNCFKEQAKREAEEEVQENELPPEPTFSEDDVAAARAQGFVDGRNEGISEMQAAIDQRIGALLDGMAAQLGQLGDAQRAAAAEIERRTVGVAAAIMKKLVPPMAREHAEDAIETLIRECLPKVMDEPRIVIRVHAAVLEELREKVDTLAGKSGFPGDIILLGDDGLSEADCRVEWADGGAEKSSDSIWTAIDDAVNSYLALLVPKKDAGAETPTQTDIVADPLEAAAELNEENPNG